MSVMSKRVSSRSLKTVIILENRTLSAEALQSLREYRRNRFATRRLPCQPKAA
ncbi:MAG: hypothetical protein QNJ20_10595 [Paracoccaceae bacterium]|nr:hypothetical protein [Paracoccaceae bacterium]